MGLDRRMRKIRLVGWLVEGGWKNGCECIGVLTVYIGYIQYKVIVPSICSA